MTGEELRIMKDLCDCPKDTGLPSEQVNVYGLARLLRQGHVLFEKKGRYFNTVIATEAGRRAYADHLRQEAAT